MSLSDTRAVSEPSGREQLSLRARVLGPGDMDKDFDQFDPPIDVKAVEVIATDGGTDLKVMAIANDPEDPASWTAYGGVYVGFVPKFVPRRVSAETTCTVQVLFDRYLPASG